MTDTSLPLTLYTAEQVREMDRIAIEEKAIPGLVLMQRAAQAAFDVLSRLTIKHKRVLICCGSGNNGGDGYLLACIANTNGYDVTVFTACESNILQGDAKNAYEQWRQVSGKIISLGQLSEALNEVDLVVDALFGTGLARDICGPWAEIVKSINNVNKPVLAIDIPSGLNANTGSVMGVAMKATQTISFIGLKQGLFTGVGRDYCGDIYFSGLDIPKTIIDRVQPSCEVIAPDCVQQRLPKRAASAHKGQCGHVLLVGGDVGMSGAIQLSAEAAARSGAGLVSIATRLQHAVEITTHRPELMCHGVETMEDLKSLLSKASVVAIGPGLGQSEWAQIMLQTVLASDLPIVVDADALTLISQQNVKRNNWVLTPHPGEAARLLECYNEDVQQDRFVAVKNIAQRYNAVVALKGSGTLVLDNKTQDCFLCRDGNPGMASGGMGDLLTGVIAALIGQGLSLIDATCCGVQLHAYAADQASQSGERGMIATDLLPFIRQQINKN